MAHSPHTPHPFLHMGACHVSGRPAVVNIHVIGYQYTTRVESHWSHLCRPLRHHRCLGRSCHRTCGRNTSSPDLQGSSQPSHKDTVHCCKLRILTAYLPQWHHSAQGIHRVYTRWNVWRLLRYLDISLNSIPKAALAGAERSHSDSVMICEQCNGIHRI